MTSGPEHYREAEHLLAMAKQGTTGTVGLTEGEISRMTAGAQVHATLALAAATALPLQRMILTDPIKAWSVAIDGAEPTEEDDDE